MLPATPAFRGAALALVLAGLLAAAHALDFAAPGAAHAGSPDGRPAAEQLAERYAPIVFVRELDDICDRNGGQYVPAPVEILFDEPGITLRDSDGVVAETVTAADLFRGGEDLFIDLPGDPRSPGCGYARDFQRLSEGQPAVAYAHIARQPGHDGFALQYWFFYYFNDWNNKHEGDWEMIQIIFDVDSPEEALAATPVATGYSQHGGGESADWDGDKVRRDGDRPHVYAAAGAHASFYRDRTYLGRAERGKGFGCDDASPPVRAVPVEARLVPETITGPDDPYAWLTYEGRWGQRLRWEFDGPTGPNMKRAWDAPFDWQDDLRRVSVEVPIGRTLGTNASQFFCDAVEFASNNILIAAITSPWMVLGWTVVLLGALGVTLSRTRFFPLVAEPLEQRRSFGQILTSAALIYARRPFLMLALGVVFIPAGIAASALQSAVLRAPLVGDFVDLVRFATRSEIAFVLGFGLLGVTIAYLVATAAVACALVDVRHGRNPTVRDTYAELWRCLPALIAARLRAAAIITLLAVTIVGVPWAVLRVVRWIFIEWAVVFEGRAPDEALEASARVVHGHLLRTAGITAALVGVAVGLGPITGVALMFLTDLPLATINGISSFIYLATVPYVGIALTLLYFDLRLARADVSRA